MLNDLWDADCLHEDGSRSRYEGLTVSDAHALLDTLDNMPIRELKFRPNDTGTPIPYTPREAFVPYRTVGPQAGGVEPITDTPTRQDIADKQGL